MRHFRVAHDFTGEEVMELTVRKGEVVFAPENVVQDGWIKVECVGDVTRRGFVPLSYLTELRSGEEVADAGLASGSRRASPSQTSPRQQVRTPSPQRLTIGATGVAVYSPEPAVADWRDGSSSSRQPRQSSVPSGTGAAAAALTGCGGSREYAGDAAATASGGGASRSPRGRSATVPDDSASGGHRSRVDNPSLLASAVLTPGRASAGGAPIDRDMLSNPNSVVEAFMKNEVYFRQLMRRRADALDAMRDGVADALGEVSACKERNAALTRKLRELDQVIDKERRRWTERLEEERAFVGRSLTYVPGGALGLGAGGVSPTRSSSRQPSPVSGRRTAGSVGLGSSPASY